MKILVQTLKIFTLLFLLTGCLSKKKMTRLKEDYQIFRTGLDSLGSVQKLPERKIKPRDRIIVTVNTESLNKEQLNIFQDLKGTVNFLVDSAGNINFPLIGQTKLIGLTRLQAGEYIQKALSNYILKPIVMVNLDNYRIKVMGEVTRQGVFDLGEEQANLIAAISFAGGLLQTARRDSILVIREEADQRKIYTVDIRNANTLFNSPAYYLQPNDIVVVRPNDYYFTSMRNQENTTNLLLLSPVTTLLGILFFSVPLILTFTRR